jgi:hypothetical protein
LHPKPSPSKCAREENFNTLLAQASVAKVTSGMNVNGESCDGAGAARHPGRAVRALIACGLVSLLACAGCGSAANGDELGVLEPVSGPFDGDITLDSASPSVGDHDVELVLVDGQGEPLQGAEIEITPFMPAHGHGSTEVTATETDSGHYLARDVSLFMPGLWELRVHVVDGDVEGRLIATFEVR